MSGMGGGKPGPLRQEAVEVGKNAVPALGDEVCRGLFEAGAFLIGNVQAFDQSVASEPRQVEDVGGQGWSLVQRAVGVGIGLREVDGEMDVGGQLGLAVTGKAAGGGDQVVCCR
jgi:hypothetical protein